MGLRTVCQCVLNKLSLGTCLALMLGKTESRKRRGQQRMRWLDGITDSMDLKVKT